MKPRTKGRRRGRTRGPFNPRLIMVAILATAIFAIAVAVWNVGDKSGEVLSKPASVSLRLNGSLGSKYAGEIIAAEAKIFAQNGIDIEVLESGEGVDPVATVVSGVDNFGVTDSISLLIARAKGQPIVAFAAGFVENSIVFYALEKSRIRSPQDFIGKRVGRRADTDSAIIYDALLRNAGLSRSQIPESATETDLDALLNDRVDVIPGRIGQEGFLLHQKGVLLL